MNYPYMPVKEEPVRMNNLVALITNFQSQDPYTLTYGSLGFYRTAYMIDNVFHIEPQHLFPRLPKEARYAV